MTTTESPTPRCDQAVATIRSFLRANQKLDGAMEAADALRTLEDSALDVVGQRERELAYSRAIVLAQKEIRSAIKDTTVDLVKEGRSRGTYDVAATEQLLVLCREVNATHGLAIEPGDSEAVLIGGSPFVRTVYGDFPLKDSNDISWRKSMTSNLGYTIRDVYALPRLKDEGEGGAPTSGPRSGPRRPQGNASSAGSSGASEGGPQTGNRGVGAPDAGPGPGPATSAKKTPTVAELTAMVEKASNDALDKLSLKLDDVDYSHEMGAPGAYSKDEVATLRAAVKKRRAEVQS
jgi:hypothetical protein